MYEETAACGVLQERDGDEGRREGLGSTLLWQFYKWTLGAEGMFLQLLLNCSSAFAGVLVKEPGSLQE